MEAQFRHLIAGQCVASDSDFGVINPASGAEFARCPAATRAQLDAAVAAARHAQPAWAALSFATRRAALQRMCETLIAHKEALAELLTREQGKPLAQAREEISRAAAQAEGMAQLEIKAEILTDTAERLIELHYVPVGVVGIITPWNAPVNLAAGPLTSALYTGNTAVLKPSPFAPLTTLRIGELLREVFPAGVLNILAGDDQFGGWMTAHAGIDKISFTGSVATGKQVMAACAATLKRLTLELGGNDAAIVLEDVDVASIAPKLFFAATVNSGQVCMAVKRIYAHEAVHEALCRALAAEAAKARLGDGMAPDTTLGPIQNRRQYQRVREILEDTHRRGATFLAGAEQPAEAAGGYFVAPAVVTGLTEDSQLMREEQFAPLIPVQKFASVDEAIRLANDTRYGLAASVWSPDVARARRIAMQLEAGTVWINQHRATAANVPFGGVKESGIGRHYSILGLKSNMEPKVISVLK